MDTLFSNVTVITMDDSMTVLTDAFVGVADGKISYLSKNPPEEKPGQIIDGTGMVLMPGLVNCHVNPELTLLRGWADDCDEAVRLGKEGNNLYGIIVQKDGSSSTSINSTKVTLLVDGHIADGKMLAQTNQGIVDRSVSVGMVTSQHVTNHRGALTCLSIVVQALLVHGVENAPMNGLESIPHVWQGTTHNDGH